MKCVESVLKILKSKNKYKLQGYTIFESVRNDKDGGGLLTADLSPVLVTEGDDNAEILVVEAQVGNESVYFINAYGK